VIHGIHHIGMVAESWEQASAVLLTDFGFELHDAERFPDGILYEPEDTRNYFVVVRGGGPMVEVLVPQSDVGGVAKYLRTRGPGLHHLAYASSDLRADTERLLAHGHDAITIGDTSRAVFLRPRSTLGVLVELVSAQPGEMALEGLVI
jgi:methylmalonyl-CoA/ethylmalonyl-CoA epimerase